VISVLIADEHLLFREAVKSALEFEEDLFVVTEAADGDEAIRQAKLAQPDVALIDVDLPKCDGITAVRLIKQTVPHVKVLVLSNIRDQSALYGAMQAGAAGYLTKATPLVEVLDATRAVMRGESIVPPAMLGSLLSSLVQAREQQNDVLRRVSRLTSREREVLALLVEGADNEMVATQLVISSETARTHIQNILTKLDVHSRLEALALVLQNDVVKEIILE